MTRYVFAQQNALSGKDTRAFDMASRLPERISTIDIGISRSQFEAMTSNRDNVVSKVFFQVDGGDYLRGAMQFRGNGSFYGGMESLAKRLPFELKITGASPLFDIVHNHTVKFLNSLSPYRLLSEYLALELFAYMDIPTPEHQFVFIQYNDIDYGLYIAVEDVNEEFLQKHFPGKISSLYKANAPKIKTASVPFGLGPYSQRLQMVQIPSSV